jgi:hypothetical protein
MSQPDRDLETAIDDLTATLRDLRSEVGRPPRPPRRPPSPREFLRFTEQQAIPAAIAVLEANIRALELLAAAIRLADGRVPESALPDRAREASRVTLDRLDAALADLQRAIEGGDPSNPEARRLLDQARDLRAEIDERIREAGSSPDTPDGPTIIPVGSDEDDPADEVDVESELDTIRDEIDRERDDDEP